MNEAINSDIINSHEMADIYQVLASLAFIFVIFLIFEILLAVYRFYDLVKKKIIGKEEKTVGKPKYRRSSVSHDWTEANVVASTTFTPTHSPSFISTSESELLNSLEDLQHYHHRSRVEEQQHLNERYRHEDLEQVEVETRLDYSQSLLSAPQGNRRHRRHSSGIKDHTLLFSKDFARPVAQDWQTGQSVCHRCQTSLEGGRIVWHDDRQFCTSCYNTHYADVCESCGQKITTEHRNLSYKDSHWHEKCFVCTGCKCYLLEKSFANRSNQLYCASCYESRFAAKCSVCGNIFRAGMKKYEHKGRQWHSECFRCKLCNKQIGTSSFIPRGKDVICVSCYQHRLTRICYKCNQRINKEGIIYLDRSCHKQCFTCASCLKGLGDEKYTTVADLPYCVTCFATKFASSCYSCGRAITGLDDPTYICFDGCEWHSRCFRCTKCSDPLVGKAFMTEHSEIFCPECCREA